MNNHSLNVGMILVATGKYSRFVEPLLDSARVHFLPGECMTFFLFTDEPKDYGDDVVTIPIKHEPWPGPTIHRYRNIIASKSLLQGMDYLFYCDVDMLFVDKVGREILQDTLVAVHHPGFFSFGTGSWGDNPKSTSYTEPAKRKSYYAGGVQGGKAIAYLSACSLMAMNIEIDEKNGVVAEWHDETHWNKLLSETAHFALTPAYCMVEQLDLRAKWRIGMLKPKIIALEKKHQEVRS